MKTQIWRTIVELSSIMNNEEFVIHGDRELSFEDCEKLKFGPYSRPHKCMSRQVLQQELDAGLNTRYRGLRVNWDQDKEHDENPPKMTSVLDELHKLHQRFDVLVNHMDRDPIKALVSIISSGYYDCMSAGMSRVQLAMLRELIEKHSIPLDTDLYGDGSLRDFLESIKEIPRMQQLLPAEIKDVKLFG